MGGEVGGKIMVFNTRRDQKKGGQRKRTRKKRERERAKGLRNTTVKRKNSVLSIILLGHV